MKKLILLVCAAVLLAGCAAQTGGGPAGAADAGAAESSTNIEAAGDADAAADVGARLAAISFVLEDGYYTRTVRQQDDVFTEMFVPEKNSFVRILSSDNEQEVFSYNHRTGEFTYLYYLADEKVIKVVYDIHNDEVVEDEDDFFELLQPDALALQQYFEALLRDAGIGLEALDEWEAQR